MKTDSASPIISGADFDRSSEIIERYTRALQASIPDFNQPQWSAILDANNPGPMPGDPTGLIAQGLWANVEDSIGLDDKWGIDTADLVQRLQSLSLVEVLAVAEFVRFFWTHTELDFVQAYERFLG